MLSWGWFSAYRGGGVLYRVDRERCLLDVELLPRHLVPLLLVHLLALQALHGTPLDIGRGWALGLLKRVAVLQQLLVQPFDLSRGRINAAWTGDINAQLQVARWRKRDFRETL